jgi:hypothetical protein
MNQNKLIRRQNNKMKIISKLGQIYFIQDSDFKFKNVLLIIKFED